jgi:glutathione S-transferase
MNATLPILYSFRRCPYAMRARMAIAASGRICELREVVLRDKPPELAAVSTKATVPVLVEGGNVIDESLDIMLWALRQNDPGHWLSPGTGSPADMLQLIDECELQFKPQLDRNKYPQRYAGENGDAREACSAFLRKLELRLCASPFLFGGHATLTDMAIAPFVRQFAHTDREWFDAQPWPQLAAWFGAWERSDAFTRVMDKYAQWKPGAAPVRFPAAAAA